MLNVLGELDVLGGLNVLNVLNMPSERVVGLLGLVFKCIPNLVFIFDELKVRAGVDARKKDLGDGKSRSR